MAKQRIPLVGSIINRTSGSSLDATKDQRFVNCFFETNRNLITGQGSARVIKRNGSELVATVASSGYIGQSGGCNWSATGGTYPVFSVVKASTNVIQVYNYAGTQVGGDITAAGYVACPFIEETSIGGVATLVAIISDGTRYQAWYFPTGGAWTQITDVDYPPNQGTPLTTVGAPVFLDGYMFIQDTTGRIWNSDINSITAWTSTSFIDAQDKPDAGAGLMRYKNYVVAAGTKTIQFFYNAGNATGSPLSRVQGGTINVGVTPMLTQRTMIEVGATIYFFGNDPESGAIHIYRLNGTAAEKVSDTAMDEFLAYASHNLFAYEFLGTWQQGGKTHIVVRVGSGSTAAAAAPLWSYCVDTGQWWQVVFASSELPRYMVGGPFGYYMLNYDRTIYKWSANYQDNGVTFTLTAQTQPIDHGTDNLKECTAFRLIADNQTTAGNVSVSYSDNDYASFSSAKTIDMTQQQKKLDAGLGWFRSRAWKITETVNRPFRAQAFEVEWEESEE
jgi:hypothetical protein